MKSRTRLLEAASVVPWHTFYYHNPPLLPGLQCLTSWRQMLLFVPVEEEDDAPLLLHWKDHEAQGLGMSKPTGSFFSGVGVE